MTVDFLIIGQGICGTFFSWNLHKEGKSFIVIDNNNRHSPSRMSAGIINPITGRRLVKVWMADELLPFSWKAYNELGNDCKTNAISQKNLIDFFPNPHQRQVFLERIGEHDEYLHSFPEQNQFYEFFNYDLGCGEIRNCYIAHIENLLPAWRSCLKEAGQLLEQEFLYNELEISTDQVVYRGITAKKIIFCDGLASFEHPLLSQLPFAPNKGEALIVEIPGLPDQHIYKKGFMLVPFPAPGIFWLGSNYQWKFDHPEPTKEFYEQAERHLRSWLKIPFKIVDHRAGLRPATLERRPFVGMHPVHNNIGILNGMGTKGCSLAPFFAKQLTDHLLYNLPITPEADVKRFSGLLRRFGHELH